MHFQLEMLSFFYVELCLVSYEMVKFTPSMIAASAVYTAQNTLRKSKEDCWTQLLKHHSGYSESQLMYVLFLPFLQSVCYVNSF